MRERTFVSMPTKRIVENIGLAKRRILYAAPGLNEGISNAILNFSDRVGRDGVTVILDAEEKVCRLGFGTLDLINLLRSKQIGKIAHSLGRRAF